MINIKYKLKVGNAFAILFIFVFSSISVANDSNSISLVEQGKLVLEQLKNAKSSREAHIYFVEAIRILENNVKANPVDANAHYWLGRAHHAGQSYVEASKHYSKAASLDPDHTEILLPMAIALRKSNDIGGAITTYKKIILLKPDEADAYNNLSWALGLIDQYKEAAEFAKKAVQMNPKSASYRDTLAAALYELGDYKGAVRAINAALKLEPNNLEIRERAERIRKGINAKDSIKFDWKFVAFFASLAGAIGLALDRATLKRSKNATAIKLLGIWAWLERTPARYIHKKIAVKILRSLRFIIGNSVFSIRGLFAVSCMSGLLTLIAFYRGLTLQYSIEQTIVESQINISTFALESMWSWGLGLLAAINIPFDFLSISTSIFALGLMAHKNKLRYQLIAIPLDLVVAIALSSLCAVLMIYIFYPGEWNLFGANLTLSRAWNRVFILILLPNTFVQGQVTNIPSNLVFSVGLLEEAPIATLMLTTLLPSVAYTAIFLLLILMKPVLSGIRIGAMYFLEAATEGEADQSTIYTKLAATIILVVVLVKISITLWNFV